MKKYIFIIILPLVCFAQNTTQNILLDSGWSIFSTHIIPNNNNRFGNETTKDEKESMSTLLQHSSI